MDRQEYPSHRQIKILIYSTFTDSFATFARFTSESAILVAELSAVAFAGGISIMQSVH